MLSIHTLKIEGTESLCITDCAAPTLDFGLASDMPETVLQSADICLDGKFLQTVNRQTGIRLTDLTVSPFTVHTVKVTAHDNHGESAEKEASFMFGRLQTPWTAKWITDISLDFSKNTSPVPLTFRKHVDVFSGLRKAYVTATAIGIYELFINGEKVGDQYFAPGFTSYRHSLQYQYYDVTELLRDKNELIAVVGGGWAVGRFTYASKSRITDDRQAFLCELCLEYDDGRIERIVTDGSWQVTQNGNYVFGDFYDGETFDATVDLNSADWKPADTTKPKIRPRITAQYGSPVTAHETFLPIRNFPSKNGNETIYDFGQNFAGVVRLSLDAKQGQTVTVRHAELLLDGELCVKSLRTAKATVTYICKDGRQTYAPRLTYMGFRYIGLSGIAPENVEVSAVVLHSDFEEIGTFSCSDPMLNKLQSNIQWSGRSNLVDIPTDCPQRDERQGWTGDITVFARTAVFNFGLSRFLNKWLQDLRSEQTVFGGIPHVIPKHGYSAPSSPTACWGDACIFVPWAQYLADGEIGLLEKQYPAIKRYLRDVRFWASLSGPGKYRRHIWKWLFQFGDWCAPGEGIRDWMGKGKWVATAYYAEDCTLAAGIAALLGKEKDARYYQKLSQKIKNAYRAVFTDGNGTLKREFQTGYVLPLYFEMVSGKEKRKMADNLDRLVRQANDHLSTGFTGTPYLLFALADNGYADTAYRVLLQDTCPSWLYCVKAGATTTWEQWDALRPNGTVNMDNLNGSEVEGENNMVSFNHYAYGAVGDFLYRRVAGLEPVEGGYKRFRVRPVPGGGLSWAKAETKTSYGTVSAFWKIENGILTLEVTVPVSATCEIELPSGRKETVASGTHHFTEACQ